MTRRRNRPVDATLVAPNLFIGGRPSPGHYQWLGVIVLCACEYQPASYAFPGVTVLRAAIDDDSSKPMRDVDISIALMTAGSVSRCLQGGQRVLATCHLGFNRSALIAGLAMQRAFGLSSSEVIMRIRGARGRLALTNPNFVKLLRRQD